MKKLVLALLLLVAAGCGSIEVNVAASFDHEKVETIAVLPFRFSPAADRGWNYLVAGHDVYEDGGRLTSDKFAAALLSLENYTLVERTDIEKVLDEKDFVESDFVGTDAARKLGRVMGVDAIVLGSVDDYSINWVGIFIFSKAAINVKCIHVESGTVLWAASCMTWKSYGLPESRMAVTCRWTVDEIAVKLGAALQKKDPKQE